MLIIHPMRKFLSRKMLNRLGKVMKKLKWIQVKALLLTGQMAVRKRKGQIKICILLIICLTIDRA